MLPGMKHTFSELCFTRRWRMATFIAIISTLICMPVLLYTMSSSASADDQREIIIIDTDAGVDDAVAILAILGDPHYGQLVKGITCVRGNTETDNVAINVLKILVISGRLDIPVYSGSQNGLIDSPATGDYYGKDGLGDANYPQTPPRRLIRKEPAASFLASIVNEHPGVVTLLMIGPMTNVALAVRLNKNFTTQVKRIVSLGGSVKGPGSVKPNIEFNIFMDPHAAFILMEELFQSGKIITMIPSETITTNMISKKWRESFLGAISSKKIDFMNRIEKNELSKPGDTWGTFDIYAACIILRPDVVLESHPYYTNFEIEGRIARGIQIVDLNNITKSHSNTDIIFKVDQEVIKQVLIETLM